MELFIPIIAFVAGVGFGFAGYRYYLKRNPEQLELIAARIKAARELAASKLHK